MLEIELPTRHLPALETYRILMLENAENIEKLKIACKRAGHEVVPAMTIGQAMQFLESKDHVDLIVAAAHLHSESVFEFLRRVRDADSHLKTVKFLMLCAEPGLLATLTSPTVEIAANLMGADKYVLMIDFDAEWLMTEIEQLLPPVPLKELVDEG